MRTLKHTEYRLEEDWEVSGYYYSPPIRFYWRDKRGKHDHLLECGYSDDITVCREGSTTYVLGENRRLGYVSLTAFYIDYDQLIHKTCFLQGDDYDDLKLASCSDIHKIKILREYLDY